MKKNRGNKTFKFNPDSASAYRLLFGPSNSAGCAICGNDAIDDLGIYPHDGSNREWQISCQVCYVSEKNTITREGAMS